MSENLTANLLLQFITPFNYPSEHINKSWMRHVWGTDEVLQGIGEEN